MVHVFQNVGLQWLFLLLKKTFLLKFYVGEKNYVPIYLLRYAIKYFAVAGLFFL